MIAPGFVGKGLAPARIRERASARDARTKFFINKKGNRKGCPYVMIFVVLIRR